MFQLSNHRLPGHARKIRSVILGLCCTPLLGAYFYNQGYQFSFLVCPIRHWTGIPCPSCGMTRSFMAMARGDWSRALTEHLFGPFLFTSLLIAASHIALELLLGQRITAFYQKWIGQRKFQFLSLLILLSYHATRLYSISKSGELSLSFLQSPLGQLFSTKTSIY